MNEAETRDATISLILETLKNTLDSIDTLRVRVENLENKVELIEYHSSIAKARKDE